MSDLTNEQRAHDVAVAMLPYIVAEKAKDGSNVSVMGEYLNAYGLYLRYLEEQQSQQPATDFGAQY